MPVTKPKAYSYLRFSTLEQRGGDSARRQSTMTQAWADNKGIELDDTLTFRDEGKSGFTGAHFAEGALGRFFELVKAGTIPKGSYLVIEALDRFSREDPMTSASRLFDLVKAGIIVVSVDDGQEYSKERLGGADVTAMLLLVVKLTQAHLESVRKSIALGEAWASKKAAARAEGTPLTSRCPEWLEIQYGRFVVREDRAQLIRNIYLDAIAGFGFREIVRKLNTNEVPAFRGKNGWQSSSIRKILTGRAVLGEYQPHSGTHKARNRKPEGDPIKDFYPAIVDEQIFWRAQAAIQGRRQGSAGRRGDVGAHILRGLARCGSCAAPMHIINKGRSPKGGVYLVCSAAMRNAGCRNRRRWRVERLERRLLTAVGYIHVDAYNPLYGSASAESRTIGALRGKLVEAEKRRANLLRLMEFDDDAVVERYGEVAKEVQTLREELEAAETNFAKLAADPGLEARVSGAKALINCMEKAEADERRDLRVKIGALLKELIEPVECHEYGAVLMLKTHRDVLTFDHAPPFALRMEPGSTKMLIEDKSDVLPEVVNDFVSFVDMSIHCEAKQSEE